GRTRTRPQEHPRRPSRDRLRRRYRLGTRAHQGARGRRGDGHTAARPADATRGDRQCLLGALPAAARRLELGDGNPSVRGEMVMTAPKVEFHFDFGSPNAYLSHLVIPGIEKRQSLRFDYVPVLLGGVYKLTGNRSPGETL